MNQSIKRIFVWSGPRNISTALMYSFAQRSDCTVVDEPLYAHYLSKTDAKNYHPGSEEVIDSLENDGEKVIQTLLNFEEKPVLFAKHMTHHLTNLNWDFLEHSLNVILTRDPKEMLTSYIKKIEHPKMVDVGYAAHLELLKHLKSIGQTPIILDSKNVLLNPEASLSLLCEKLGIPFDEKMLHWKKGAIKEDGCWAKYWYKNVHQSTGFGEYRSKNETIPERLMPLYKECAKIYEDLKAYSI